SNRRLLSRAYIDRGEIVDVGCDRPLNCISGQRRKGEIGCAKGSIYRDVSGPSWPSVSGPEDFACAVGQISGPFSCISRPPRGTVRDGHGGWTRDAMDAQARKTSGACTDGEIVWS